MKIEVLGPGCKNCDTLYENVLTAVDRAGLAGQTEVVKVKDIDYFLKKGRLCDSGPGSGRQSGFVRQGAQSGTDCGSAPHRDGLTPGTDELWAGKRWFI